MGLDVWFREDVARVLRAAYVAGREAQGWLVGGERHSAGEGIASGGRPPVQEGEMAAYWRGYQAALATIGVAFGLGSAGVGGVPGEAMPAPLKIEAGVGRAGGWDVEGAGGWE
jgi:hypothetical protein